MECNGVKVKEESCDIGNSHYSIKYNIMRGQCKNGAMNIQNFTKKRVPIVFDIGYVMERYESYKIQNSVGKLSTVLFGFHSVLESWWKNRTIKFRILLENEYYHVLCTFAVQ